MHFVDSPDGFFPARTSPALDCAHATPSAPPTAGVRNQLQLHSSTHAGFPVFTPSVVPKPMVGTYPGTGIYPFLRRLSRIAVVASNEVRPVLDAGTGMSMIDMADS